MPGNQLFSTTNLNYNPRHKQIQTQQLGQKKQIQTQQLLWTDRSSRSSINILEKHQRTSTLCPATLVLKHKNVWNQNWKMQNEWHEQIKAVEVAQAAEPAEFWTDRSSINISEKHQQTGPFVLLHWFLNIEMFGTKIGKCKMNGMNR